MRIIRDTKEIQLNNTAVTLGKFDGLHKGHMCLVNEVIKCKEYGMTAVLFTFDISPYELLSRNNVKYVLDDKEKYEICEKAGIDVVVEYPFDAETMNMDANEFVEKVLIEQMDASKIIVGQDFHFGKNRQGDIDTLKKYSQFELVTIDKILIEGMEVSSTEIREAVGKGEIEKANQMLGHPVAFCGDIIHGKQIGRTIGTPTINMPVSGHRVLPPFGVYSSMTHINGKQYLSITNIGINPTVSDDEAIKLETHLLECDEEMYGDSAKVCLYHFIRSEKKFDDISELQSQISKDIEYVKNTNVKIL